MPRDAHHPFRQPERAIVVPRARRAPGAAALPLQTLVAPLLAEYQNGIVQIVGPPLSGKTAALRHLAAVLPLYRRAGLFDDPTFQYWRDAATDVIAIVATAHEKKLPTLATFYLAKWTIDDCVEYLAAVHRPQVKSVLDRIVNDGYFERLMGLPGLVRIVLDELAADMRLADSGAALRRRMLHPLLGPSTRDSLARIATVKKILTADTITESLVKSPAPAQLMRDVPFDLVVDLSIAIKENGAAARRLAEILHGPDRSADAIAASILLKINPLWRPWVGRPLRLSNAILDGARWDGIDLQDTVMEGISLRGAHLTAAVLNRIDATSAIFSAAVMTEARLDQAIAPNASFVNAEMERVRAEKANFLGADFRGARMSRANLLEADLGLTDLTDTDLSRADLRGTNLKATFDGTILTRADLTGADLKHSDLRTAILDGARFAKAKMLDCNLEGCKISSADFEYADLGHAYLTGSVIREGIFRGANLTHAGLADIDWEGADLRDADLTSASFHMGSTRSGLVRSVIPCEGSKTGFYTDEFKEQDFKAPEEIRKANLCGADLRGAKIDGVDFYLVDLRGAKYTSKQAEHLARCGAILRSRVA